MMLWGISYTITYLYAGKNQVLSFVDYNKIFRHRAHIQTPTGRNLSIDVYIWS